MFAGLRDADTAELLGKHRQSIRILDLGNGRLRPQYLLLKAKGYRVYGIDIVNRPEMFATSALYMLGPVDLCLENWSACKL